MSPKQSLWFYSCKKQLKTVQKNFVYILLMSPIRIKIQEIRKEKKEC